MEEWRHGERHWPTDARDALRENDVEGDERTHTRGRGKETRDRSGIRRKDDTKDGERVRARGLETTSAKRARDDDDENER